MCASVCDTDLQQIRYLCHSQRSRISCQYASSQTTTNDTTKCRTSLHAPTSFEPCNVLTLLLHTQSHRVRYTTLTRWHRVLVSDAYAHRRLVLVDVPCKQAQRTETNTRHNTVPRLNTSIIDARRHTELHVVLAYCRQYCTTNKLTTRTTLPVPRPKKQRHELP